MKTYLIVGCALMLAAGAVALAQERPAVTLVAALHGVGERSWGTFYQEALQPGPHLSLTVPALPDGLPLHLAEMGGSGHSLTAILLVPRSGNVVVTVPAMGGVQGLGFVPGVPVAVLQRGGVFLARWPHGSVQLNDKNDCLTLTGSGAVDVAAVFD